jgi:hypothetical protein
MKRNVGAQMKPHLWLITFIGVIVPRRLRADWRREWEAELRYRKTPLAEWPTVAPPLLSSTQDWD